MKRHIVRSVFLSTIAILLFGNTISLAQTAFFPLKGFFINYPNPFQNPLQIDSPQSSITYSTLSGKFHLAAYGYNEEGTTEGFEGNTWDYFTAGQTSQGAAFLKAANNAHLRRLHLWITQGREKQSLSEIHYILNRVPNHPRALVMAELIEKLFQKQDFAMTAYKKALNLFPQYAFTHAQFGKYLTKIGRRQEGINSLKQAIEMDPKLAIAHAWLSEVYLLQGKNDLAENSKQLARKLGYKGKIQSE